MYHQIVDVFLVYRNRKSTCFGKMSSKNAHRQIANCEVLMTIAIHAPNYNLIHKLQSELSQC